MPRAGKRPTTSSASAPSTPRQPAEKPMSRREVEEAAEAAAERALRRLLTSYDQPTVEAARQEAARTPEALADARRIRLEHGGVRPWSTGHDDSPSSDTGIIEDEPEPTGAKYRVLHGAVGRHFSGQIVYASQLGEKDNIQRLLDMGAIVSLGKDDAEGDEYIPPLAGAPVAAGFETEDDVAEKDKDEVREAGKDPSEEDLTQPVVDARRAAGDVARDADELGPEGEQPSKAEQKKQDEAKASVDPSSPAMTTGQPIGPAPEPRTPSGGGDPEEAGDINKADDKRGGSRSSDKK